MKYIMVAAIDKLPRPVISEKSWADPTKIAHES